MSCHPGQVFLPGAVPLAFPLQQDGCQACCSSHHPYPVHASDLPCQRTPEGSLLSVPTPQH